ncbi:MAG: hypothetical protein GWP10_15790 [Nitrospiraceae bacterium]|nr:hypothetical protein [Nitrospiraceae bacterium]
MVNRLREMAMPAFQPQDRRTFIGSRYLKLYYNYRQCFMMTKFSTAYRPIRFIEENMTIEYGIEGIAFQYSRIISLI